MRYALISDVHANLEALTAVLRRIDGLHADRIVCLGDLVGYNAEPDECVRLIRSVGAICIAGNHDRAAVSTSDPKGFPPAARHAVLWTRDRLSVDSRRFLAELPGSWRLTTGEYLVHAALHPQPNDRYHLSTPARVTASLAILASGRVDAEVCFFGHTHRPAAHHLPAQDRGRPAEHVDLSGPSIDASQRGYYLMNPGSVGQPRDGDPRAACAIWDSQERVFELHRVAYDVERARESVRRHGLDYQDPLWKRPLRWMADVVADGYDLTQRAVRKVMVPTQGGTGPE